jgi:hypothetical protein
MGNRAYCESIRHKPENRRDAPMSEVNRNSVIVDLFDVFGNAIRDNVEITFYNQRAQSLNLRFSVRFQGAPATLPGVPAFPCGLAEVYIRPTKYRAKSIFVDVPAGSSPLLISQRMFVDPERVTPIFPAFSLLQTEGRWAALKAVLAASGIGSDSAWNNLKNQEKAGLFNLFAKMQASVQEDVSVGFDFIRKVELFYPERIFAWVDKELLKYLVANPAKFASVSGELHDFEGKWKRIDQPNSFKTRDDAGILQLTFAADANGDHIADIDIDDHSGVKHAFDVIKHNITGKDTHPYNIHQILLSFQGIDPGYRFT